MHARPFVIPSIILAALALSASLYASDDAPSGHDHANCPMATSAERPPLPIAGPEEVGQDAFVALAEMKALLESNADTDWSRVDLGALREHLVDMNRVVLDSETRQRNIEGGFEAVITGEGRTLDAILRMVPAHASFAGRQPELDVSVEPLPEGDPQGAGLKLRVTTKDTSSVDRLRGLGFFGFLVSGDHHRPHHFAMASGSGHP